MKQIGTYWLPPGSLGAHVRLQSTHSNDPRRAALRAVISGKAAPKNLPDFAAIYPGGQVGASMASDTGGYKYGAMRERKSLPLSTSYP